MIRRWAREPLVAFLVAGALLFGVERARRGSSRDGAVVGPTGPIVVDAAARKVASDAFRAAEGRDPDAAELTRAVDAYVEEETLFREGLRLGLERDDPKVRQRVAQKTLSVLRASLVVAEPTEQELRAHFDAHPERWERPALLDFSQVFVEGSDDGARARATTLLGDLTRGAEPSGLGDTFAGGRRYRQRSVADLAERFGDAFVAGLAQAPLGRWELRESRHGLHLVRVERRTAGAAPSFEEARRDVAADLFTERRDSQLRARVAELRRRHPVSLLP